jgi:hypothetical protein
MRLDESPTAEAVATRAFLVEFFDLVAQGESILAEERVAREAFPNGAQGPPSPRAEDYVTTGEWDDERTMVPLRLIGSNVCGCRIGTSEPVKVCIVDSQLCTILNHKKPMLQRTGWLIGAGRNVGNGVFNHLFLPTHEHGGPVTPAAALQLSHPIAPFTMRIPMWKFVFQAYSEDLLGLVDSPVRSVNRRGETLDLRVFDGAPEKSSLKGDEWGRVEGMTRLVTDGGLPVLGKMDGGSSQVEDKFGTMADDVETQDLLINTEDPERSQFVFSTYVDDQSYKPKAENEAVPRDEDDEAQYQAILKSLASTRPGSFGQHIHRAARIFDRDQGAVTVPNVTTAAIAFMDEHFVPMRLFKDLTDRVVRMSGAAETKAVRDLDARVKLLSHRNEELERKVILNATALESHVAYVETLTQQWKAGLTEAQKSAADANSCAHRAVLLAESLRGDITNLGGKMTQGKGITFYRQSFRSHDSFVTYVTTNHIGLGCAGDAFLLMHGDAVGVVSNEESLAVKKALLDNKLATGLQGLVVSSFTTSIPAAFAPSKSATVAVANSTKDILKRSAPKYESWEDEQASGGLRFRLEKAITACRGRVDMAIESSTEMSSQGRELCTRITADSERFANALIDFITRLYPTTKKTSGLSDNVIWELCIELLSYILDEIVKARNGFSDAGEAQPAYFLWGMLQAWEIQQRYLSHNFINDPALNGIFVRRAILRSMDSKVVDQVRELMSRVLALENKTPPAANKTPGAGRKRGKNAKGGADEKDEDDEEVK